MDGFSVNQDLRFLQGRYVGHADQESSVVEC